MTWTQTVWYCLQYHCLLQNQLRMSSALLGCGDPIALDWRLVSIPFHMLCNAFIAFMDCRLVIRLALMSRKSHTILVLSAFPSLLCCTPSLTETIKWLALFYNIFNVLNAFLLNSFNSILNSKFGKSRPIFQEFS